MTKTDSKPSHSANLNGNAKTTKNKPKESCKALFFALSHGPKDRKTLSQLMAIANSKFDASGDYCGETIRWHHQNGRLLVTKIGNYSMYSLTSKGKRYAKERGIL